jgi:hypothetical protein
MPYPSSGRAEPRPPARLPVARCAPLAGLCTALLLLPAVASAQAGPGASDGCVTAGAPAPYFAVVVNGDCFDLSSLLRPAGRPDVWSSTTTVDVGGSRVQLALMYDADPFITFGATTTNLVAGPVTYAFLFGTPIVPGFYNHATSTAGISVTNGSSGTSTVAAPGVAPTYVSGYGTAALVPTDLGVGLGTAACVAGPAAAFTVTKVCNQGSTANTFAPAFYDGLEALLTYTQDDVSSVASWSGAVTLTLVRSTVPEPGTVALLATGLVAVGGVAARRRRTA